MVFNFEDTVRIEKSQRKQEKNKLNLFQEKSVGQSSSERELNLWKGRTSKTFFFLLSICLMIVISGLVLGALLKI